MKNGQKAILYILTARKKIVSLYEINLFYISTDLTELDALVQFMGHQANETAQLKLPEHWRIQNACIPLPRISKQDRPENLLTSERTNL